MKPCRPHWSDCASCNQRIGIFKYIKRELLARSLSCFQSVLYLRILLDKRLQLSNHKQPPEQRFRGPATSTAALQPDRSLHAFECTNISHQRPSRTRSTLNADLATVTIGLISKAPRVTYILRGLNYHFNNINYESSIFPLIHHMYGLPRQIIIFRYNSEPMTFPKIKGT